MPLNLKIYFLNFLTILQNNKPKISELFKSTAFVVASVVAESIVKKPNIMIPIIANILMLRLFSKFIIRF